MVDLLAALSALLMADPAVAALVGTGANARVFAGELPAAQTAHMPRTAIVLALSGGPSLTGRSFVEADTQRVDLFAYGRSLREAEQLRFAASAAMRRMRRGVWAGVLIHWVQSTGGVTSSRDPALAWPRAFQSFQVFHALEPAA